MILYYSKALYFYCTNDGSLMTQLIQLITVHKELKAHHAGSYILTVGPWSFWEDFKRLQDEFSKVSQLDERML